VTLQEIWQLLSKLSSVDHIVLGSAARLLLGDDVPVADLDICPRIDRTNLTALAASLTAMEARPCGPRHWESIYGRPSPNRAASLGELEWRVGQSYRTAFGMLDVVPRPSGVHGIKMLRSSYEHLITNTRRVHHGPLSVECVVAGVLTRSGSYQ